MKIEEMEKISKEHDFKWLRDMPKEDYIFLTEKGNLKWIELINKVACHIIEEKNKEIDNLVAECDYLNDRIYGKFKA